jgi:hypothetical protein
MSSDPTLRVQSSEAQQLRQLVKSLVTGDHEYIALQNEMWVESVGGCSLDLRIGTRDDGVRQVQPLRFECVLSPEGWRGVEELLEPFSESDSSGFEWLTTKGGTPLLISANGQW